MRTFDRNTLLYRKNTFFRKCFSTFAVSFIHIKKTNNYDIREII